MSRRVDAAAAPDAGTVAVAVGDTLHVVPARDAARLADQLATAVDTVVTEGDQ